MSRKKRKEQKEKYLSLSEQLNRAKYTKNEENREIEEKDRSQTFLSKKELKNTEATIDEFGQFRRSDNWNQNTTQTQQESINRGSTRRQEPNTSSISDWSNLEFSTLPGFLFYCVKNIFAIRSWVDIIRLLLLAAFIYMMQPRLASQKNIQDTFMFTILIVAYCALIELFFYLIRHPEQIPIYHKVDYHDVAQRSNVLNKLGAIIRGYVRGLFTIERKLDVVRLVLFVSIFSLACWSSCTQSYILGVVLTSMVAVVGWLVIEVSIYNLVTPNALRDPESDRFNFFLLIGISGIFTFLFIVLMTNQHFSNLMIELVRGDE